MELISIKDILHRINCGEAVRSAVPMGMGAGLPMLNIANGQLLVSVFYYRSVPKPDDKTELFAPRNIISASYPDGKLAAFRTLPYEAKYADTDFSKPVGTFRHKAIQHLDRKGYIGKKEELYAVLDKQITYLAGQDGAFAENDRAKLRELYGMLCEPSLRMFYRDMSPKFYDEYFTEV